MKKLLLAMGLSLGLFSGVQANDLFSPVRESVLRAPSVPLVVSDPYFSIWSPYDKLNEGATEHWTNAKKPLLGALRVDGEVYRFMGKDKVNLVPIIPMTDVERWEASYTRENPGNGWQEFQFDDNSWKKGKAAFGTRDQKRIGTEWKGENTDIYIRRTFEINNTDLTEDIYLIYSHDDVFELYLNGEQLVSTGEVWRDNVYLKLSDEAKKKLRKGKNVIAAHCHNTTGGAYVDFGLFSEKKGAVKFSNEAVQKSVTVMATSTYYTFACGPVELDVVFTAPQLIDDLDLLSTPINYISYRVRSTDKKEHDVQLYVETTPELSINEASQPTVARTLAKNGISYVEAGSINQPICDRAGDLICADWGYAYLAGVNGAGKAVGLGDYYKMKESFVKNGNINSSINKWTTRKEQDMPSMAYVHQLGKVSKETSAEGYLMMGYDDIYSIEYMYEKRMGYWKHDGKVTIFDAFEKLRDNYSSIMDRCRALDAIIYDDAEKAGGQKYAEICAASYRQVMAAHKLFTDKEGNLMWFSKENNSNGCVNTVDLTYPSAPLFLIYNPELEKAMMTSIFEYSASGRWNKPFAAHDLGTYPIANGQVYGGDMPIEESGNMVILAAAIAKIEGNADYAKKYWDLLTLWTDYLVQYGQDPENQLCTDDFAGHWAHNANLSVKAIMGVAGYAEMARMLGMNDVADKYAATAKKMADKWKEMAAEGDHYRLAFDRPNTWSQKYNMVWDKMWNLGLFTDVIDKEVPYYLTKQNEFGLPLDSRKEYTKSDWIMWTAAMAPDMETFQKFVDPMYKYVNETKTRVPISDWYHTDSGLWVGFRARSVIGGHWMKVLMDKMLNN